MKLRQSVFAYSVTHFLIDLACAFLMFGSIAGTRDGFLCILLYNFCAFAMQMPIGIIADKLNRNFLFAIIGCFLVAFAFGFVHIPIAATIIVGIGNAVFHIGGGIDVLNISREKLSALGIFVSPGAFGIYLGATIGKGGGFPAVFFPLVLIAAAGLIFALHKTQKGTKPENAAFSLVDFSSGGLQSVSALIAIAACFFFVVCLRSFAGLTLDFPWRGSGYMGIALLCAVVFGKVIGGFAADRLGLRRTVLFSLSLAALLFLFPVIPAAGITAVLLFNMTMPITLWAMAKIFPGAKGFAFGLLTFGLFLGFLPVYFGPDISGLSGWLFTLIAAVSLVLLLLGLRRARL
jgi:FSR family fosmidomycin resistance protein-like MFS transporter